MKYVLSAILVSGLIFILLFRLPTSSPQSPSTTPTIMTKNSPTPASVHAIQFRNTDYSYSFSIIRKIQSLILIPNFTQKKPSTDIAEAHTCQYGINGGFYDTANQPLGGFKSDGKTLKKPIKNRLIDGYFWKSNGTASITFSEPPETADFFVQVGPVLLYNSDTLPLKIVDDEAKRRSIVGITRDGAVVFLFIHALESVYEGPFLGDMSQIVSEISAKEGLLLVTAANLDGGSASAFTSPQRTLQELSPIGSFICSIRIE